MANTFGILAAFVLAFSAFVAYKNKEEYNTQIAATDLQSTQRDRNTQTFNGLVEDIAGLDSDRDTANQERDEFQVKLEAQQKVNEDITKESKESKSNLDDTKTRLTEKKDTLQELGPIAELAPKIEKTTISIQELEDQVAILNAQVSRLRGDKSNSADRLAAIKKKLSNISSGRSLPTMKTSIRSISSRLGFVTLGGGMKDGVTGGSKVAVMRGGVKIAELSVTAVSENTATADVIQSSLKNGDKVSVGDKVVAAEVAGK